MSDDKPLARTGGGAGLRAALTAPSGLDELLICCVVLSALRPSEGGLGEEVVSGVEVSEVRSSVLLSGLVSSIFLISAAI